MSKALREQTRKPDPSHRHARPSADRAPGAPSAEAAHAAAPTSAPQPPQVHPSAQISEGGVKTFVLDTNVLLHNPGAIFVFAEHNVVIPFSVIEELDTMKKKDDDLGRNARS